ncbi:MAG: DUF1553 domain-containing protein [Acidobacteria bacterium]|nr:DUF1553 domain-containing protein [Acidobacteriota bacterium]
MGRAFQLGLCCALLRFAAPAQPPEEFFEKRIRPIFAAHCQACHGPGQQLAGLDLSSASGFRRGVDSGPLVDSADLDQSRLLRAVGFRERVKMPPAGKLAGQQIADLREWVRIGAPWPAGVPGAAPSKTGYPRAGKDFWSFQPLRKVRPPAVRNAAWARDDLDRFILAKLEENGLEPAPPAGRLTLLRRVTLDLTGLPPSETEIREFLAGAAPDPYPAVVERLLASPRYGERWGRHWLDVARYADSTGADEDYRYPYAWRYRDYVIDAFNRDLPYDRFVKEQIAGDLLAAEDGAPVNPRGIIATGFLALGPKLIAEQDKPKMFYDIVDEQIEVAGKAFLGLTLACARCHDHKFDPVSIRDYYSLASIFASTKQLEKIEGTVSKLYFAPLVAPEVAAVYQAHQKKIERQQEEIDELTAAEARLYRDRYAPGLARYMLAARRVYAEGGPPDPSLDQPVLERWVEYLRPSSERRIHLEPWYQAASPAAVAPEYQRAFLATAAERDRAIAAWKEKADAARALGQDPPERPRFQAGENRFYSDVTGAKGPLALPEKDRQNVFSAAGRERLAALERELERLKNSGPPEPPFACGVAEGKIIEQPVFLRGNPETKGEIVPKALPAVLAGRRQPLIASGSGRLELANWLADPANPLTARVMANRIWQWHFGEGLVRTPSNFGSTGERPTHPELLDHLAARFIAGGWSMKALHRSILLSSAYRMSSQASPEVRERDPENRLWSRFRMRRLSIEELRDSLLAIDGSLDLTMGGTLQKGFGTDKEFSEERKSLNPDSSPRRLVYLPLRRSNLPSLLSLFDFGDASTSTEARSQTNVAPQALYMMNSRFVAGRARSLATWVLAQPGGEARRLERAWAAVQGRFPAAGESEDARRYIAAFPGASGPRGRLDAWSSFCRTLIASNDFMYVH